MRSDFKPSFSDLSCAAGLFYYIELIFLWQYLGQYIGTYKYIIICLLFNPIILAVKALLTVDTYLYIVRDIFRNKGRKR